MANQTELLNVSNEMKLDNDKQNLCEELSAGELCSSSLDTTEELYSSSATDAYRNGVCIGEKVRLIKKTLAIFDILCHNKAREKIKYLDEPCRMTVWG